MTPSPMFKLTNRDGATVLVNMNHVLTIEPIQAHAKEHSAVVFNHNGRDHQTKTLIVRETAAQIDDMIQERDIWAATTPKDK